MDHGIFLSDHIDDLLANHEGVVGEFNTISGVHRLIRKVLPQRSLLRLQQGTTDTAQLHQKPKPGALI